MGGLGNWGKILLDLEKSGFNHLDISPYNIMVNNINQIFLIDYENLKRIYFKCCYENLNNKELWKCSASISQEWSNSSVRSTWSLDRVFINVGGVATSWVRFSRVGSLWWVNFSFLLLSVINVFLNGSLNIISIISLIRNNEVGSSPVLEEINLNIMPSLRDMNDLFSSSSSVKTPVINNNLTIDSES